MNQIRLWIHC